MPSSWVHAAVLTLRGGCRGAGLLEGAPGGNAEAELGAEVKLLREELSAAQEAAAAATGHAKQFEMLARTSEEALTSMQADHNKFKEEAHARWGGCQATSPAPGMPRLSAGSDAIKTPCLSSPTLTGWLACFSWCSPPVCVLQAAQP